MPRPVGIPDWVYPGTEILNSARERWMIMTIEYRAETRQHSAFLQPLQGTSSRPNGTGWWHSVEDVAVRFHPHAPPPHPAIQASELRDYAHRGLINVGRFFQGPEEAEVFLADPGAVIVQSTMTGPLHLGGIEIPAGERVFLHCPEWEGSFVQLDGEHEMQVAINGAPAMPYLVREINVNGGTRFVLEPVDVAVVEPPDEPDAAPATPSFLDLSQDVTHYEATLRQALSPLPNSAQLLADFMMGFNQVGAVMTDALRMVGTMMQHVANGLTPEQLASLSSDELREKIIQLVQPKPPARRVSVWERLAEMKRGPDVVPGGAGTLRQTLDLDTTPDAEPEL